MSFRTALSGLNAAQIDLDVTGNNIANANTNGFKESRAEFADVYATTFQGVGSITPGSGVRVSDVAQQFTQGNVDFTNNNLDLSINGEGFFTLSDNGAQSYTRAGAFKVDREGNVVNHQGQRLQVFPATVAGTTTTFNTGSLTDLQMNTSDATPQATSAATVNVNVNSSETAIAATIDPADPTTFHHSTSMVVYDSLGNTHTASMYFQKTASNSWDMALHLDGGATAVSTDTLTFNTSGVLTAPAGGTITYNIPAADLGTGAAALTFASDISTTTQFGSPFGVNNLVQDGFASGRLNGINISEEGIVFASFTNGQSQALGQVALAKFPNSQGLSKLGDTNWAESFDSGIASFGSAGSSNFGAIQSGSLEASNVDVAEQLVNLIVAQRNFQANAKTITTEDTITQAIINIR
ncbi:MAG: flagellar hook protein FlgE [Gammaproteobacteria bacterium]|nr:MAG: flagellar hook protein FlgE [Gammaproteobacteria bacterium]RLA21766.1 MAG: flagellar hook protein FlgE [Gammaproteobacteria bacterium]